MKLEKDLNAKITDALACYHPQRIEDMYASGIPDINFVGGWIEDKYIPANRAPKNPEGIVKVDHYNTKQRAWHMRRSLAGGRIYVALGIGEAFFLFDGRKAAQHLGIDWRLCDLSRRALLWTNKFDGRALREFIRLDCGLR